MLKPLENRGQYGELMCNSVAEFCRLHNLTQEEQEIIESMFSYKSVAVFNTRDKKNEGTKRKTAKKSNNRRSLSRLPHVSRK